MLESGREAGRLAIEVNGVIEDYPLVEVVTDGAWTKISCKAEYNSLSCLVKQVLT